MTSLLSTPLSPTRWKSANRHIVMRGIKLWSSLLILFWLCRSPRSPDWPSPSPQSTREQATWFILSPGEALDSHFDAPCGWGLKTWSCPKLLGAHKIHCVTEYLTKSRNFHFDTLYWYGHTLFFLYVVYQHTFINICCILQQRDCWYRDRGPTGHKHCELGTWLGKLWKQPCDKRSSLPVAN